MCSAIIHPKYPRNCECVWEISHNGLVSHQSDRYELTTHSQLVLDIRSRTMAEYSFEVETLERSEPCQSIRIISVMMTDYCKRTRTRTFIRIAYLIVFERPSAGVYMTLINCFEERTWLTFVWTLTTPSINCTLKKLERFIFPMHDLDGSFYFYLDCKFNKFCLQ